MNKIQYDRLQLILADMKSLAEEDPNTEGFIEAFPFEMDHYIQEISDIFNVPVPTKSVQQLYKELHDNSYSQFEKIETD